MGLGGVTTSPGALSVGTACLGCRPCFLGLWSSPFLFWSCFRGWLGTLDWFCWVTLLPYHVVGKGLWWGGPGCGVHSGLLLTQVSFQSQVVIVCLDISSWFRPFRRLFSGLYILLFCWGLVCLSPCLVFSFARGLWNLLGFLPHVTKHVHHLCRWLEK